MTSSRRRRPWLPFVGSKYKAIIHQNELILASNNTAALSRLKTECLVNSSWEYAMKENGLLPILRYIRHCPPSDHHHLLESPLHEAISNSSFAFAFNGRSLSPTKYIVKPHFRSKGFSSIYLVWLTMIYQAKLDCNALSMALLLILLFQRRKTMLVNARRRSFQMVPMSLWLTFPRKSPISSPTTYNMCFQMKPCSIMLRL